MGQVVVVERKRPLMAGELTKIIYQIFSLHKHTQRYDLLLSAYTLNMG
jgi:hypothetical protein